MENPPLLVLDEPMNGLDKNGIEEMRALFLQLKAKGTTILLASHVKDDIEVLCDTVSQIVDGVLTRVQ
jgi:ABC-2 type transport system ATP-binding protein